MDCAHEWKHDHDLRHPTNGRKYGTLQVCTRCQARKTAIDGLKPLILGPRPQDKQARLVTGFWSQ